MAERKTPRSVIVGDGWTPGALGWRPTVQGGYVPTTSQIAAPPTGGSAVKPVKR